MGGGGSVTYQRRRAGRRRRRKDILMVGDESVMRETWRRIWRSRRARVWKAPVIQDLVSRICFPSTTDPVVQGGRFIVLRPEPGQGEAFV